MCSTSVDILSTITGMPSENGSVEIFCSYSRKDEAHRKEFEAHVALLRRENLITIWQDRKVLGGEDWAGEIDSHLNSADIVTLFVSSDFLDSDYCYEKEMKRALERHASGDVRVVPIIVRPCDWHTAPFKTLQAIPTDGKPITLWTNKDEAWTVVANCLRVTVLAIIERLQARLKEIERRSGSRSVEESVAFIFDTEDPEQIEKRKTEAYDWARRVRAERSKNIGEIAEKIGAIQQKVFAGADPLNRTSYERWYEYVKGA